MFLLFLQCQTFNFRFMNKFQLEAQAILERIEACKKVANGRNGRSWGMGFPPASAEPNPIGRLEICHDIVTLVYAYDPEFPGLRNIQKAIEYSNSNWSDMAWELFPDFIKVIDLRAE